MSASSSRPPEDQPTGQLTGERAARRRLLRGGAAAAPVVLTLTSKAAMATTGTCTSASAFASLNASRPANLKSCAGQKPTWWRTCPDSYWHSAYPKNKKWKDCGLVQCAAFSDSTTLIQVVNFTENSGYKCVAAHVAAAMMNAKWGWTPFDVLGEGRVKTLWQQFCANSGFIVPTAGVKWFDTHPTVVAGVSPGGFVGYMRTTMI